MSESIGRTSRFRMAGTLALAYLLTAAVPGLAASPEVALNTQVNEPQLAFPDGFLGRSDATIAAGPGGHNVLAGWEDLQGLCGPPTGRACPPQDPPGLSGFGYSTDGGQTWTDGGAPFVVGNAVSAGHPWLDRGGADNNTYFFTSRVRDIVSRGPLGLSVHRGHFVGSTFVWDDATVLNSDNPLDFYSRQAIAAAKDGSGAAYVTLSNIIETCEQPFFGFGQIELWHTADSGDTWEGPVVVSPDVTFVLDPDDPLCGQTGILQIASSPAIGPSGEVYVVWQYGPTFTETGTTPDSQIRLSRSLDGGQSFDPPVVIADLNTMRENPPVGYGKNRMNDHPRIAVAATGPHLGRVYVTYYQALVPVMSGPFQQSVVSSQVYIVHSDDQGDTWSSPVALAAAPPPTGLKRFWPTVAVRPSGAVDVVYLQSQEVQITPDPDDIECDVPVGGGHRVGTASSLVDTYWVQSQDGGETFSAPLRVSTATGNWCAADYIFGGALFSNFGDYLGISTAGDSTFAGWGDARNGVPDLFFGRVDGHVSP